MAKQLDNGLWDLARFLHNRAITTFKLIPRLKDLSSLADAIENISKAPKLHTYIVNGVEIDFAIHTTDYKDVGFMLCSGAFAVYARMSNPPLKSDPIHYNDRKILEKFDNSIKRAIDLIQINMIAHTLKKSCQSLSFNSTKAEIASKKKIVRTFADIAEIEILHDRPKRPKKKLKWK